MKVRPVDVVSPEGRIASVARSLCDLFEDRHAAGGGGPARPDVADFRDALKPYMERELLRARIDEARHGQVIALTGRMRELDDQMRALEKSITALEAQS